MSLRKISADCLFPVSSPPIPHGVLVIDSNGTICHIGQAHEFDPTELETYPGGVLVPGFVNTHCHLELSHMKGKVATGTSLIPFITQVVTQRSAPTEHIQHCIAHAEQEMIDNGIVAVGDISNTLDTFYQKSLAQLRYYTFVEFFDLLQPHRAQAEFDAYKTVYDQLTPAPASQKNCVPHAPYSVSPQLFQLLETTYNDTPHQTVCIHNQETPPEIELFEHRTGAFYNFYASFGLSLEHFQPPIQSPIQYAMQYMSPKRRTLFVHNTLTTPADIQAAHEWSDQVYWATCPNANLYIENRLPNYQHFIQANARMTIGTDSLTSNWSLSILEEMKTIARYQSYIPFEVLLRWATLHGAQALGFDDTLGSFAIGKAPGINLIRQLGDNFELLPATHIQKIR